MSSRPDGNARGGRVFAVRDPRSNAAGGDGSTPENDRVIHSRGLTLRRAQRGEEHTCRSLVDRFSVPVFALLGRVFDGGRRGDRRAWTDVLQSKTWRKTVLLNCEYDYDLQCRELPQGFHSQVSTLTGVSGP